ncbi:MAG: hypothetical protein R3B81_00400 [bacterium]
MSARAGRVPVLATLLVTVATAALAQEPIIDVSKRADRRIAIGVGRFETLTTEEVGSPAGDVVAFDLEVSGWFEPKRPGMLPPRAFEDWARLGAEVVAEVRQEGGTLVGAVRDAGTGDVLFRREYPSGRGESLRQRLHRYADDVVLALTGEPGIARSRLTCEWVPPEGGDKRVVTLDLDGFNVRELTGERALEVGPRWAPNGKSIVYTSFSSGFPDVYVHDLVLGARDRVAHYEGLNADGDISPDGRRIALVLSTDGNPEIYTKDLDTGRILRLTANPATESSPVWSPDGRRLAFVSDRTGGPQIWVMNPEGHDVERVTLRGTYNTAPDWSPDGTRIAYCALRSDGFQVQVVDLATREVTTVTDLGGCEDPCWAPDGRSILYSRKAGGRTDLYVTNLTERRALRVTRGDGRYSTPDWSPVP